MENVLSVKPNVTISFVACNGELLELIVRPTVSIQDLTDHQSYGFDFSDIFGNDVNPVAKMNNALTLLWLLIENKEKFSHSKDDFLKCIMPKSFAKIIEALIPILNESFSDVPVKEKQEVKSKKK